MEKVCERSQESIAVGVELSDQECAHLKICAKCTSAFNEYESLKMLVLDSSAGVEVPLGFADAVMSRIELEDHSSLPEDWTRKIVEFFERLMAIPQAQYLALVVGGAVSLVNLMRFVFFVVIPV